MTTTDEPRTDTDAPGPGPRRRRTAVIAGAAVLAAGAIATPFLVRAGDDRAPAPTDDRSVNPVAAGALTGDVDGDGKPDVVTLSHDDLLRVRLGSGGSVAQLLQDRPRLEGLADVGGRGLAVAISHRSADPGRDWTTWVVDGHALKPLPTRHRAVIGTEPGSSVAWVDDGRLYDGSLDVLQSGDDQVAVLARSWSLQAGRLASSRVGVRCWDRTTGRPPAPCAPGQDWTYDVGPRGDLPALLPTVQPAWPSVTHASFGGATWSLRKVGSGDPESSAYVLSRTGNGTTQTARVPRGWAPSLFPAPVRLDSETQALLLSQEGGDSDTWRVYADRGGRLAEVATRGPLPLGGGFSHDGDRVFLSWLTPDGSLYTRVGTGNPGHYRVYAWQPIGGDATTPPTLQALDLGTVCIDDMWQTYGTCAR